MNEKLLLIDVLQVAGLRIISNGGVKESTRLSLQHTYPRYTDKQLAMYLRMLANYLDEEEGEH